MVFINKLQARENILGRITGNPVVARLADRNWPYKILYGKYPDKQILPCSEMQNSLNCHFINTHSKALGQT